MLWNSLPNNTTSGLLSVCLTHGQQPSKTWWMHMRKTIRVMGSSCGCASSKSMPVPLMRQSSLPKKLCTHQSSSWKKFPAQHKRLYYLLSWKLSKNTGSRWLHHKSALHKHVQHVERGTLRRIQILTWSQNWRTGTGEGSTWTMMQLLAKVNLEYTWLKNIGQWQNSNPNNQIVALQVKVNHLSKTVYDFKTCNNAKSEPKAGAKPPVIPWDQTIECPTWTPKEDGKLMVTYKSIKWKYCAKCNTGKGAWNKTDTSTEHDSSKSQHKKGSKKQPEKPSISSSIKANLATSGDKYILDF